VTSPFTQLGLADDATPSEVRAKWQELRSIHHPDHGGDADKFHELQTAYEAAFSQASLPVPCLNCGGSGKTDVRRGFNVVQFVCQLCHGAGVEARSE
jgi:DnaJ-class molecular chaperone